MSTDRHLIIRIVSLGTVLAVGIACGSDHLSAPNSVPRGTVALRNSAAQPLAIPLTLPRGVRVPPGTILTTGPAPYDSKRESPAPQGSVPQQQLSAEDLKRLSGPRGARSQSRVVPPSFGPATNEHALYWADSGRGIFGTADAGRSIAVPTGWDDALIYSPTHLPAGGSCLEMTTIHWKTTTYHQPTNSLGFFDWCNAINWALIYNLDDAGFRANYLRSYSDDFGKSRELYWFEIQATFSYFNPNVSDCWTAYLYNYSTGYWNGLKQICGFQSAPNLYLTGWSMYESLWMQGHYNPGQCVSYPSVRAGDLQIWNHAGSWVPLDSTTGRRPSVQDGTCWLNGSYTFVEGVSSVSQWYGWTPSN